MSSCKCCCIIIIVTVIVTIIATKHLFPKIPKFPPSFPLWSIISKGLRLNEIGPWFEKAGADIAGAVTNKSKLIKHQFGRILDEKSWPATPLFPGQYHRYEQPGLWD